MLGARGGLWLHPVMLGLNGAASQEPGCYGACLGLKSPLVMRKINSDLIGAKILPIHSYRDDGRFDMVHSGV
jgi:hypothetical protein